MAQMVAYLLAEEMAQLMALVMVCVMS